MEHDPLYHRNGRAYLDIGPMAGRAAGRVGYNGPANGITACKESITGQYLSGQLRVPYREEADYKVFTPETPTLQIRNACANNLKNLDLDIPLGMIVGIAGVSGSGKTAYVKVLIRLLHRASKRLTNRIRKPSVENVDDWEIAERSPPRWEKQHCRHRALSTDRRCGTKSPSAGLYVHPLPICAYGTESVKSMLVNQARLNVLSLLHIFPSTPKVPAPNAEDAALKKWVLYQPSMSAVMYVMAEGSSMRCLRYNIGA